MDSTLLFWNYESEIGQANKYSAYLSVLCVNTATQTQRAQRYAENRREDFKIKTPLLTGVARRGFE